MNQRKQAVDAARGLAPPNRWAIVKESLSEAYLVDTTRKVVAEGTPQECLDAATEHGDEALNGLCFISRGGM